MGSPAPRCSSATWRKPRDRRRARGPRDASVVEPDGDHLAGLGGCEQADFGAGNPPSCRRSARPRGGVEHHHFLALDAAPGRLAGDILEAEVLAGGLVRDRHGRRRRRFFRRRTAGEGRGKSRGDNENGAESDHGVPFEGKRGYQAERGQTEGSAGTPAIVEPRSSRGIRGSTSPPPIRRRTGTRAGDSGPRSRR